MGSNSHGQLGINDIDIKVKNSPILVESLMDKKPSYISCGSAHTVISTCNYILLYFNFRGRRSVRLGGRTIWCTWCGFDCRLVLTNVC